MTVDELSRIANRLRLDVVETVHDAGDGHPGPCMSIADIMAVLFFEEMKLEEIAAVCEENVNTVKSRLYRTLKKLKLDLEV